MAGVGLIGLAAWAASRPQEAAPAGSVEAAADDMLNAVEEVVNYLVPVRSVMWSIDKVPPQYRAVIAAAEADNGIPAGMLARLLYQESRYRPEIIDGRKRSPTGAMGIAQFMPATAAEMGVDPLDPMQAIPAAGRYLAWLYGKTGGWSMALAAYNWGIGNVMRKGLSAAPKETRDYYSQIMADLGMGGVYA